MGDILTSAMDNQLAWHLGDYARKAATSKEAGDQIDRGLILLRLLNEAGFDIVRRDRGRPVPKHGSGP